MLMVLSNFGGMFLISKWPSPVSFSEFPEEKRQQGNAQRKEGIHPGTIFNSLYLILFRIVCLFNRKLKICLLGVKGFIKNIR